MMADEHDASPGAAAQPTVLERIVSETRAELERRKRSTPLEDLVVTGSRGGAKLAGAAQQASAGERRLRDALSRPGIAVIAEFKRRSPSVGRLGEDLDVDGVVSAYERGGASAVSVLTEGPNFAGSLDDLRRARMACGLPVLRKDFVVDRYQLYEAQAAGADAVLLIVAALDQAELAMLRQQAQALGLDALVEVHDATELRIALDAGADLIGVNNRDLRDFSVDVERTFTLLAEIPEGVTVVSESGIASAEQVRRLEQAGVHAVLVGESLIRSPDPEQALRALRSFSGADVAL
jgi:indole-3-glycerol phosphate synthase